MTMRLKTQSYNNGGSTYNAAAEETAIIDYEVDHYFGQPAEMRFILSDPTGVIARKYNADANDVYIGAGKVTFEKSVEDPVEYFFKGRIIRAVASTESRTVTLYCQDWLSQLDDELFKYDMREDLDGSGTRSSVIYPDYDDTDGFGIRPAGKMYVESARWYNHDDTTYTDITSALRNETANDAPLLPTVAHGIEANDACYIGFYSAVTSFKIAIGTDAEGTFSGDWEYWDGDSWESLSASDGTNDLHNDGECTVSWTDPGDWAESAIDGSTCYWVRWRVTNVANYTIRPLGSSAWTVYLVYDSQIGLTADAHNGQYFILTDKMAGAITTRTGPYAETVTPSNAPMQTDSFDNDIGDLWTMDTDGHALQDDEDWYVVYSFKTWVDVSSFFDSIIGGRVIIYYTGFEHAADEEASVELYNGASYDEIGTMTTDIVVGRTIYHVDTFTIPDELLATVADADGITKVKINAGNAAGGTVDIRYIAVELDVNTTGYSTATAISDGETYRLTVATNFAADATKVWTQLPYCIAKPIYKHIDSAEGGTLITGGDDMETLTCAATIEHTSGISTRQYVDRTRLDILRDLAIQDKAELYIALGTTTVTWKSTWNDGAPTAITDTDVNSWTSTWDWQTVANEFNVYGMRIGDRQLYSNVTDAISIAKFNATRTRTVRDVGLVSEYDTNAKGTALVNQYKDPLQLLTCTIAGLSTLRLGSEVSITSTYLGLSADVYIVDGFSYRSQDHLTTLSLHPRVSTTGLQRKEFTTYDNAIARMRKGPVDKYVPSPNTDVVT